MSRARPLGFFDVACIGVNAVVGSSIFLFPGRLAALLGPASILAFGLTALLLAPVALCFAELSARHDGHGGPYLYAREAFGPDAGFAIGWMCWMTEIVSFAAVADGVASYLGYFHPGWTAPWAVKSTAAFVIAVLAAVNYRGVKLGAWTTNVLTVGKLVPLALLVAAGLPRVSASALAPFAPHGLAPLGKACFLAYFAFQGFEVAPVPAGEVADARRVVPRAVLAALGLAAALYMLVQATAVGLVPALAASERPLADAAAAAFGAPGAALMAAGAVVSTIGFCAGCALGGPRYVAALGALGDLPAGLAALHERHATPHRAVLWTAGLSLAAALLLDFERLVDVGNVVVCAQYLATCAAVPALRRRAGAGGGWALGALGCAATLWLGAQGDWAQIWAALGLLAAGFLARALWRRGGR